MAKKNMIRKAVIQDVPGIQKLINDRAKEGFLLPRSLNEIYDNLRDFSVYEEEKIIYGCAALHVTWEDLAEIRSLVVHESRQGRGIGKQLAECCIEEAKQLKIKKIFLLTEKPEFFGKLGFVGIDKALLPHKIWNECVQCVQFPDCNELAMIKEIGT